MIDKEFDEPGLEDDGGVLDDDEPVAHPPAEDELRACYPVDGGQLDREPEPAKLDEDPDEAPPENPDEPFIPDEEA